MNHTGNTNKDMNVSSIEFHYEKDLVETFCSLIASKNSPWPQSHYTKEFSYSGGKTDILLLDNSKTLIALEAKLHRWREALQQAFRNTAFAHESYVLLPRRAALRAANNREDFLKRNVGLLLCDADHVEVLLQPSNALPIQSWLCKKAVLRVMESNNASEN